MFGDDEFSEFQKGTDVSDTDLKLLQGSLNPLDDNIIWNALSVAGDLAGEALDRTVLSELDPVSSGVAGAVLSGPSLAIDMG